MAEIVQALPYPFSFNPLETVLLIIDMQRDFIESGGFGTALGNDVTPLQSIVPATLRLLTLARKTGMPVINTRECHKPDLSDCPPAKLKRNSLGLRIGDHGPMGRVLIVGEPGAEILDELAPIKGEIVLNKPGKGAFYNTDLSVVLDRLRTKFIILAGVTPEVCVQPSMREANDRGFECLLAEDATESYFPEFKHATLKMIRAQGAIVGWTAKVSEIAEALNE